MRGLVKAALLFAPALTTAAVLPVSMLDAANTNTQGPIPRFNPDEELPRMRLQLTKLENPLFEKERYVTQETPRHSRPDIMTCDSSQCTIERHFSSDIMTCDSLKCTVRPAAGKAREAAHSLYGKISENFCHGDDKHRTTPKHYWPGPPHVYKERILLQYQTEPDSQGGMKRGMKRVMRVTEWAAIGLMVAFLLFILQQQMCTPQRRADRQSPKDGHLYRRTCSGTGKQHILTRLIDGLPSSTHTNGRDYREKAFLVVQAEDGSLTSMAEEPTRLDNAPSAFSEFISSEQGRILPLQSTFGNGTCENLPKFGEEKDLLPHIDNDSSDESDMISVGFRYTPETVQSASKDINGNLGPDSK
ncbi:hypothetical protein HYALB_00009550 [Hymenoscyphus albidus]|uniref:Uncharacterized protein n=1 Tax=Hymenoscyphus albidus TaxID=595503 RepID=A0A9N9LVD2_9HELO|nr:hypothetical protein HYALB_00009550 [Hymenoscyphus albidus]